MIDLLFPTAIYIQKNLISEIDNSSLKDYCTDIYSKTPSGGSDWIGGTYTTHGSYECSNDVQVKSLINSISEHVHNFAKNHGCSGSYNNYSTWMNINNKNEWQEFHSHPNSIFSAVYYVSAPEGSGNIIFEDPREPDMLPLKNITKRNSLTNSRAQYKPEDGMLIIFRSYLRHMVQPGSNTHARISFALNFN